LKWKGVVKGGESGLPRPLGGDEGRLFKKKNLEGEELLIKKIVWKKTDKEKNVEEHAFESEAGKRQAIERGFAEKRPEENTKSMKGTKSCTWRSGNAKEGRDG